MYRNSDRSPERQALRPGLAAIDTDTVDFYDGPQGLPPPHRFSSHGSAYPDMPGSPQQQYQQQQPRYSTDYHSQPPLQPASRPTSAAYSDPFANGYGSSQGHRYSESLGRMDQDQQQQRSGYWPPGKSGQDSHLLNIKQAQYGNAPYGYQHARNDSMDEYTYQGEQDAWHGPETMSGNLARDRYLQRKSAEAAASGAGLLGHGSKESGYGYSNIRSLGGAASMAAIAADDARRKRRRKWLIFGSVLAIVVALAVVIGVVVSRKKASGSNSGSSSAGTSGVVKEIGGDPSKFETDPRLHNSFYGMAYTPLNAQYPACGDTLPAVIEDVQLMSQLTTRLRLYGSDCNVTALVLEAIRQTKVNMTVFPAVWINDDDTIYQRGADALIAAVKEYGTNNIDGISVGNEYLLNGGSVTNLIAKMADMRQRLLALNLPKAIPVGTGEAGSLITAQLAAGSDYIMSNNHPYFAGTTVQDAAGWVWQYTNTNAPSVALTAPNKPTLYIGEVGWPSGANVTSELTFEGATAGIPELQTFLDTYVCQANANGTTALSFWFEAFDEPWKEQLYGGVEAYWGLFTSDKQLKNVTIPDCPHL